MKKEKEVVVEDDKVTENLIDGQRTQTDEQAEKEKQQRSDFMFALAGIRLECCKMSKMNNGEVNLTRAEKFFQYVISGTK